MRGWRISTNDKFQVALPGCTRVTDPGLRHLSGLSELEVLWLDGTRVTDTGLHELTGLTKLQAVIVNEGKVTDKGAKQLRQALPHCYVSP